MRLPFPPPADTRPIVFCVRGKPVGKARPRFSSAVGTKKVHVHKKPEYEAYLKHVARTAHAAAFGKQLPRPPYWIEVIAIFKRPQRLAKADPGRLPIDKQTTPDIDNVVGAILDGLMLGPTGRKRQPGGPPPGIIVDDSLVNDEHTMRRYAAIDEEPHVEVMIREGDR